MIFKGVLFDFDGTLTLPGALDFEAVKKEIRCPDGLHILEYLETLPVAERPGIKATLEKYEMEAALRCAPNHGAESCLERIRAKGLAMGILTRNSLNSVTLALRRFESVKTDHFAALVGRDEARPKPHPEGVWKAASLMGLLPQELLVVGDFRFDVIAGFQAGARCVLLSDNPEGVMQQGDPEPDYVVRDLLDILDILGVDGTPRLL